MDGLMKQGSGIFLLNQHLAWYIEEKHKGQDWLDMIIHSFLSI